MKKENIFIEVFKCITGGVVELISRIKNKIKKDFIDYFYH